MGISFRKSFKAGPIRVNLSKSGIGMSAGVKGARIGVGPRGTYVSGGKGGARFYKTLNGGKTQAGEGVDLYKEYSTPQRIAMVIFGIILIILGLFFALLFMMGVYMLIVGVILILSGIFLIIKQKSVIAIEGRKE
ncbi:MAG: DUF4236 domain-containing protein [Treponema sp.]|jgi:hypothetical protein|nr:DUF4236 domain-containing protein [Treponema sp.]